MKNGIKTSEFWLAVVAVGVGLANEFLGLNLDAQKLGLLLAPVVAYIAGRSYLKTFIEKGG